MKEAIETPREVTQDIRAQAKAEGYRIEQKVTVMTTTGAQMYPYEDPDRPWYVRAPSGRTPFTYECPKDLWFGPFASEEEAANDLPRILRLHARAEQLEEGYCVRNGERNQWRVGRAKECVAGPFDNPEAAMDEAERLARKSVETRERMAAHKREQQIERCQIPAQFSGITLDNFTAETEALSDALLTSRAYVQNFTPPGPFSRSLWFCGDAGTGKTSLACAIAAALALSGRSVRYSSVEQVIKAQDDADLMNDLRMPDLLVLDWTGIQAAGDNKPSRDQAALLGVVSGRAVGTVLEVRYKDDRPTLLVADCDRAKLQKYLSRAHFEKLQRHQIVEFQRN
jgi:DNA replication protein DnaC